jgi:hypothetical protein
LEIILGLSKTHYVAVDQELFTPDQDYRLRVNPAVETENELLQRTIIERADERVSIPEESVAPDTVGCNCFKILSTPGSRNSLQTYSRQYEYLATHNAGLAWV